METPIFIAKIISVLYLTMGFGFLLNGNYYKKELGKMFENISFLFFAGMSAVIIGLSILEYHNVWAKNWTVIITLIGWISLAKGIVMLVCPKSMIIIGNAIFKSKHLIKIMSPFVIILGLIFAYFGFFY